MPIRGRIGSFYNKGASSTLKTLELSDLELPDGGRLHITLEDVPPQSMKKLDELFQILSNVARQGDHTGVSLEIEEPDENCAFVRAIRKK